ncbi:hypothetical protein ACHAXS_002813 [Conticribra weissflogii]
MSFSVRQARRSLCTAVSSKLRLLSPLSINITTAVAAPCSLLSTTRTYSAAKPKTAKKHAADDTPPTLSYQARKDLAKQKRRDAYARKLARLDALKTRRDDKPDRGILKRTFMDWYSKEIEYHSILERKARQEGKPWKIRVAALVERLPVVTPDMEEWEREFVDLQEYLMTFGKVYPPETGLMPEEREEDHVVMSDEEMLTLLPFTPAPRETEADATGDLKTRDRRLKTFLYLAVRTKNEGMLSDSPRWTLPSAIANVQADEKDGDEALETLLQTARRAVSTSIGNDLTLWCPSNAPVAINYRVYNKNLPEEFRGNYYGEKIFYYRVQWDSGDVDETSLDKNGVDDYAWLTKEEMLERVEGERGGHQAKFFKYLL